MQLGTPSDDYRERMKKKREESKRREFEKKFGNPTKPSKSDPVEVFIPYGTMFKLEPYKGHAAARGLICVCCGQLLEWRIYTISPETFDSECPSCKMTTERFWKNKVHRKVTDA